MLFREGIGGGERKNRVERGKYLGRRLQRERERKGEGREREKRESC